MKRMGSARGVWPSWPAGGGAGERRYDEFADEW